MNPHIPSITSHSVSRTIELSVHGAADHINLLEGIADDTCPRTHDHRHATRAQRPANPDYDGIGYLEFKDKAAILRPKEITRAHEDETGLEAHDKMVLRCRQDLDVHYR